jgi:hypothetical protein
LFFMPFQKLGSLITWHIVRSTVVGFVIRFHVIQILGHVKSRDNNMSYIWGGAI